MPPSSAGPWPCGRLGDAGTAAATRGMAALGGNVVKDGRARVASLPLQAPDGSGTGYALAVTQTASSYAWLPWLLALTVLLVVGLSGLLCKEMARAATRPLGELDAAGRIAKGDFGVRTPVRSRDEVGRLAATFNAMAAALGTYVDALDRKEGELHRDLARVGEMLSSTHDLDRILTVVLETAMASVDATAGAVLLVDGQGDLHLSARRGLDEWAAAGAGSGPETIAGRVLDKWSTAGRELGSSADLQPAPGEPHLQHVMVVPLGAPHRIHGVLSLYNPSGGRGFRQRDLELIRTFAGQGATAVENVLLHREAQRLSITDGLTGLWNYRYLSMALIREIERAERFARPLALLVLDLDHFKAVNDRFGHPRGDAVLIELGKRLTQEIREIDTLARYGGEEFVLLLPETDFVGAEQPRRAGAGGRTRTALRRTGCRTPPAHRVRRRRRTDAGLGMDLAPLLRAADAALYEAKAQWPGLLPGRSTGHGRGAAAGRADAARRSRQHTPPPPPTAPRDRGGLEVQWDEGDLPGPKPGGARTFDLTPAPAGATPCTSRRARGRPSPQLGTARRRLGFGAWPVLPGPRRHGDESRDPGCWSRHAIFARDQGGAQGTAAGRRHSGDRDDRGGGFSAPDCLTRSMITGRGKSALENHFDAAPEVERALRQRRQGTAGSSVGPPPNSPMCISSGRASRADSGMRCCAARSTWGTRRCRAARRRRHRRAGPLLEEMLRVQASRAAPSSR